MVTTPARTGNLEHIVFTLLINFKNAYLKVIQGITYSQSLRHRKYQSCVIGAIGH